MWRLNTLNISQRKSNRKSSVKLKLLARLMFSLKTREGPQFRVVASHVSKGCGLSWERRSNHKAVHRRIKLIPCDRCTPVVITRHGGTSRAIEKEPERIVALQRHWEAAQVGLNPAHSPTADNVRATPLFIHFRPLPQGSS